MKKAYLNPEILEDRSVPSVSAVFNSGILTVTGDDRANTILVGADAGGKLTVTNNGQEVAIRGANATRDNAKLIVIDGKGGNDNLQTASSLNKLDANGVLVRAPNATLLGGNGNDFLKVGHGGIVGGLAGVDAQGNVVGKVVGNAFMDGGKGNDSLVSGFGNDIMLGGDGDDNYLWPPGTLTDIWDGGAGNDTVTIIGNDGANDAFSLTADGDRVRFDRTNLVQFGVDIAKTENIVLKPGTGDDVVTINDLTGVAKLKQVKVLGGDGDDVLNGSAQLNKAVKLVLDGGAGLDTLLGGAGKNKLLNGLVGT